MRTGKSIFSANCSCLSFGQDLYSGITIFPINFPTEWLITVDSSAFFAENEKITYAALVGIEKAKSDVKKLTNAAVNQLDIFENSDFLKALALSLVNRKK